MGDCAFGEVAAYRRHLLSCDHVAMDAGCMPAIQLSVFPAKPRARAREAHFRLNHSGFAHMKNFRVGWFVPGCALGIDGLFRPTAERERVSATRLRCKHRNVSLLKNGAQGGPTILPRLRDVAANSVARGRIAEDIGTQLIHETQ
jgi:hypothetical protein